MLTILIQAYCVDVVVDIKPIYLKTETILFCEQGVLLKKSQNSQESTYTRVPF